MEINSQKNDGQLEITVKLSNEEFKPYILEGARRIANEVKLPGFRPGKAPYAVIKAKVGEMTILEEAARVAINHTIDEAIKRGATDQATIGQPNVDITKLAPDNPLEYKIKVNLLPKVTIKDYTNLAIKRPEITIPEEQINKTLEQLREANAQKVASLEPAKMGDLVIANIQISVDKVPIEGGQGQNVNIILGKDYLVPGFDQQLLGAVVGQELQFQIPYPKDHYQKALAGKLVDFKVKINEIWHRQLPKLDDQLAKNFGFENLAALKENIKDSLMLEKQRQLDNEMEIKIFEELINRASIEKIPESLINKEAEAMLDELQYNLEQNGGNLNDYLSSLKKTKEQFILEILPQAVKRVKTALIIKEITRLEGITTNREEVDKELDNLKEHYKDNPEIMSRLNMPDYREYLANVIVSNKTVRFLKDHNLVTDNKEKTAPKTTKKPDIEKPKKTTRSKK
ncbi:MAG TPA: trigger factor [Patescibacteria group bacterium]|jgi:trigger factor|nr:trigger factor [bacterium]HRT11471.1 trigger factor [Patescibacteria group bacterium]HRU90017.1 trigger factor [Patescibacteria group bacterium]